MLLLFIVIAFASGQSPYNNPYSYLDRAVTGFDPYYTSVLQQPDPGTRSQIFNYFRDGIIGSNPDYLNSFISQVTASKCKPNIVVKDIVNYEDYRHFELSSRITTTNAYCGPPRNDSHSFHDELYRQNEDMLKFFEEMRGELVFASSKCVTHIINIIPLEPINFSQAFQTALATLNSAANNSDKAIQNRTFSEFVQYFGTHFSRRALFGSRATFGIKFASRSTTETEKRSRKRCVAKAVREVLTPGKRWSNETTQMHFSRASAEWCGEEQENRVIVTVVGELPKDSLEDWASAAKKYPQPILHELEPFSTLFKQKWFTTKQHQNNMLDVSGAVLDRYFTEYFSKYNSRMEKPPNCPRSEGCGINSDCEIGVECIDLSVKPYYKCAHKEVTTMTAKPTTTTATTPPTTATLTSTAEKAPPTAEKAPPITATAMPMPAHTTVETTCGDRLTAAVAVQNLTSHRDFGSSHYQNFVTRAYRIEAPHSYRVHLRFSTFVTESCCDHLFIYDGRDPSKTLLADLSGTPVLTEYTSSDIVMFLLFTTDRSNTREGFSLQYQAVP